MHFPVVIIGGGASALMCAAFLKKEFAIIEANAALGAKIAVSGGGRCNFTNEEVDASYYTGDMEFISTVLQRLSSKELISLVKSWGVPFESRKNRQLFCKESAKQLLNALCANARGGRIMTNCRVSDVERESGRFVVRTSRGSVTADKVVVASGGVSFTQLGASDIGYKIAAHFGHEIVTPKAALVGFTIQPQQAWFKELSGVSVSAVVSVAGKKFADSVLFAHKGISGPAILNASLYWQKGSVLIDFLSGFDLAGELKSGKKQLSSVLPLPKRMTKAFLLHHNIGDMVVDRLTQQERELLLTLQNYSFAPAGTFGFSKAEITSGGVSTRHIDASTMQSTLVDGLYFIGEVLDVNGELGGYNFHWAFASALVCSDVLNNAELLKS